MADVTSFQAQAICAKEGKEILCSELIGKDWPLKMLRPYEDYQEFEKDYWLSRPKQKGLNYSPTSVRYFWKYEYDLQQGKQDSQSRVNYTRKSPADFSRIRALNEFPTEDILREKVEFETYTLFVQNYLASINSFRKLYIAARRELGTSVSSLVEYCFEVLAAAKKCKDTYLHAHISSACSIPEEHRLQYVLEAHDVRSFRSFPLLEAYEHLMDDEGLNFQNKYGSKITFRNTGVKETIPFWRNSGCHARIVQALHDYCTSLGDKDTQFVTVDGVGFIQQAYLQAADRWLSYHLYESRPIIDSDSLTILWQVQSWEDAAYMKLFCDMINAYDARGICTICGKEFSLGNRANKKYCPRHTPEEIRSYQQKIKNLKDKTSQK